MRSQICRNSITQNSLNLLCPRKTSYFKKCVTEFILIKFTVSTKNTNCFSLDLVKEIYSQRNVSAYPEFLKRDILTFFFIINILREKCCNIQKSIRRFSLERQPSFTYPRYPEFTRRSITRWSFFRCSSDVIAYLHFYMSLETHRVIWKVELYSTIRFAFS